MRTHFIGMKRYAQSGFSTTQQRISSYGSDDAILSHQNQD
jgi:hypothetical protein